MKLKCNLQPNKYLNNCDSRDVISFDSKDPVYVRKLFALVKSALDSSIVNMFSNLITRKLDSKCNAKLWFEDGENCEILKAGSQGWQKGKMKLKINLTLEFIPDEPEEEKSPLDDVRQELEQNNSQL